MTPEETDFIEALGRSDAVNTILRVLSRTTGLRMALVARVTPDSWLACATLDEAGWGLQVGGTLDVTTTYCRDVSRSAEPLFVPHASQDPTFRNHPGYVIHGIETYIAVPLVRRDGTRFGVLCALDPNPTPISTDLLELFKLLSQLVMHELEADEVRRRLDDALREAEEANHAKDVFLATLSHELRTPLNAMLGWANLLRAGGLPPEAADRGLEVLERSAQAQARLIEDLLDVSRIISGKVRLAIRPIELGVVVAATVESVRPSAEAKGLRIEMSTDADRYPVSGDADRIQQVCWNLLTNAIKFTPSGGAVTVRLSHTEDGVELVISDTGLGIEPEFLPHVFGQFRQADGASTRRHGGLGLGLAIVKHLVEMHGGSVKAESDGKDRGAAFRIVLPLGGDGDEKKGSAAMPGSSENAAVERGPSLDGVDVLVVDDVEDARILIRTVLEQRGARVRTAASVAEAMGSIEERPPDVLISDVGMPDEDGYALIRKLRNLPAERGGRTPAVALTAFAQARDRARALLAGFQHHLAKPIDPGELCAVVAALTGKT